MNIIKNIVITGAGGKPIALDVFFKGVTPQPVIIYAHGFNGFKDWGGFDSIADQFAMAGFVFVKFNFSHNGTTPDHPDTFVDLEAFGNNNYTKELFDLQQVIDWVVYGGHPFMIDRKRIYLIGHSRGGSIAFITAKEDQRIAAVTSWASVKACNTPWGNWPLEKLETWKKEGVAFYPNGRTGQQMPLYYQLMEDYQSNIHRFDVMNAVSQLEIPVFICHGTNDEAVPVNVAHELFQSCKNARLFQIASDHVFGRKHPWTETFLPPAMQEVVAHTILFFNEPSTSSIPYGT
jgi:dienelactone hydrolase